MTSLLQKLNDEVAALVERVGRSLVQVHNGGRSGGAGVIIHPDGLIVTNAHVVRQRSPQVTLPDGTTLPARVLAWDPELDLAALVVERKGLEAMDLGESRRLQPGQWVLALGHPWGIAGAVTAGTVIGGGSELPEMPASRRDWIAINLALRPGNSGGPLVDEEGRLVGINTMLTGPEVGMAVPVHVMKAFLKKARGAMMAAA